MQTVPDGSFLPLTPTEQPHAELPLMSKDTGDSMEATSGVMSRLSMGTMSPHNHSPLPPSTLTQYHHLPTPQSPNDFGQYIGGVPHTPESPLSYGHAPYPPITMRPSFTERLVHNKPAEDPPAFSSSQQIMTPESSPYARRDIHNTVHAASNAIRPSTPTIASPVKFETPIASLNLDTPRPRTPPARPTSEPSSHLSSPFMAKLSDPGSQRSSRSPRPVEVDDIFSAPMSNRPTAENLPSTSVFISPPLLTTPLTPSTSAGGELERIRQSRIQESLIQSQDLESRRPEYLQRAKRTISETELSTQVEDESRDRDRSVNVGITESPHKGRRLTLFQETSEESFEESLMAGGYGRYRTADWVRQPQPMALPTPGPAGPSNIVAILEEAEVPPPVPTEKDLKKRKRLEAFRNKTSPPSKLFPVELEGKGRVLLDIPSESLAIPEPPSPTKKLSRRKKAEITAKEKRAIAAAALAEETAEKPNWPDAEFPWRLRMEERTEIAKLEEQERLRWIERFLDRDSDDEDEGDSGDSTGRGEEEVDLIPSNTWGLVYEGDAERPTPSRGGRGKMVPLHAGPEYGVRGSTRRNVYFPSDPADARAALLSKKSVRALSYRQQRRLRAESNDSDEEVVCICRGTDDGRELVQCDKCKMWFHLKCIGINNIAELGKEEDPWFCDDCTPPSRASSSEPEEEFELLSNEPIFVPTDETPHIHRSFDAPFFHSSSLQDSPMPPAGTYRMPKTPTRGNAGRDFEFGSSLTSGSSRIDSSGHGPSTPRNYAPGVRIHTNTTPGPFDGYEIQQFEEMPFDPTSTPSRGIQFGGASSFATPKTNVWASRGHGSFQTPSKPHGRPLHNNRTFGGPGFLSSTLDDGGSASGYPRMMAYDDSPVRRTRSNEGPRARRILGAPLAIGPLDALPPDEYPAMRSKGKERLYNGDVVDDPY